MASPKPSSAALLLLAAAAVLALARADLTHDNCVKNKKVTVQNLCSHDVTLTLEPLANSPPLFAGTYTLHPRSHAEFPVCWWTGRLRAPDAAQVEFHVGVDGGSFYLAPNAQPGQRVPVSVTPHGSPLQGRCPAVGCAIQGRCSVHQVPSGDCRNVQEMKIIYCNPHV
ncbi:hypothetical protein Zm00014a_041938 [Zea mays]|jgi:hypothetical protein|uniref:Uncharacterized protein n=2 Tax=Zea mays TaxID=4577 RepID=B6SIR7_MAIZE|nr:uncharacterized protein LOC100276911 precursor [Zea mays]ACG24750.1 hypothetical protein [Zea mays]ACG31466.1 hypothetical protein [Zea mays]ACG37779.1 hypothetical protein [Zea mays]ONM01409.1 hypothetical protein ZEAMMB73_Zm00001d030698 [Zea mays]PWZ52968.1 hypothetical protein Zm00014a_041938 [Zea mays]|eukprot:NP_001144080.1 uncharacterized protein LOC100276911 precursor [Zea mays]